MKKIAPVRRWEALWADFRVGECFYVLVWNGAWRGRGSFKALEKEVLL